MSDYRLIIQPEAEQDLAAARAWYEQQRIGLGERFVGAIDDAFEQLKRFP